MGQEVNDRFKNPTFDDYKQFARDESLSPYEKVGFPISYREGKEARIFEDIRGKLSRLSLRGQRVLEIGPGCSGPAKMMIQCCREQGHTLILADSPEMLALLPEEPFIVRAPGRFPQDCGWLLEKHARKLDVILAYSVLHIVWADSNPYHFLDLALGLLADGGEMLLGDIPNLSKRRRFFASAAGIEFHQRYTGTTEVPQPQFNELDPGKLDDAFLVSILLRCRNAGFDAYWLPQPLDLPMANRREDILIRKP